MVVPDNPLRLQAARVKLIATKAKVLIDDALFHITVLIPLLKEKPKEKVKAKTKTIEERCLQSVNGIEVVEDPRFEEKLF